MTIVPIGSNAGVAGRHDREEGFLAIGRRMVKVQLGKEIADSSYIGIWNYIFPMGKNDAYYLDLAERTIKKDPAWKKEYETRIAAYCHMFEDAGIMGLPQEKVRQIREQARKYPLIQEALENLKEESLPDLIKLSDLIAETVKDDDDEMALMQLTTLPQDLRAELEKIKTESKRDLKELELRQKSQAVTAKALQFEAALFQAMIEGKEWADLQPKLETFKGSANKVYKLYQSHEPDIVAAFFKVGDREEESAGRMEKMMWDMAVILGFEESFVATGETEVKQHRGGIQPAQQGTILNKAENLNVSREEITKGILISIIFGMFDAHNGNIFITTDNKIKFFDNTRSMPNSDGYLNDSNILFLGYRCALLDQPVAHEPLNPNEINSLKAQVASVKEKMFQLRNFLKSPHTESMVKKLPPGWLDVDASFQAMNERIERVEKGLREGKIKTAFDLVIECNPDYKFAFATNSLWKRFIAYGDGPLHNALGLVSMKTVWEELSQRGYDLNKIKNWCDDPSHSIDDLLSDPQLFKAVDSKMSNDTMMQEISDRAAWDFKDVPRKYCESFAVERNFKALQQEEGVQMCETKEDAISLHAIRPKVATFFFEKGEYYLVYQQPEVVEKINFTAQLGKIKIGEREVPIKGLVNNLNMTLPSSSSR